MKYAIHMFKSSFKFLPYHKHMITKSKFNSANIVHEFTSKH